LNEISKILGSTLVGVLDFDEKNIFNNWGKQDGYIDVNNINLPEKLVEQYEETIYKNQIEVMKLLLEK